MEKQPLLLRDNFHSVLIFLLMMTATFMIIGPVSLTIKEALVGLAVFLFLVSFIILSFIKGTDKTLPRYIYVENGNLHLIYWDMHEKIVCMEDITYLYINANIGKFFDAVVKLKTKDELIVLRTEIIDAVTKIINNVSDSTIIEFNSAYAQQVIKDSCKASQFAKDLRLYFGYFIVLLFWLMAIFANLQLYQFFKP